MLLPKPEKAPSPIPVSGEIVVACERVVFALRKLAAFAGVPKVMLTLPEYEQVISVIGKPKKFSEPLPTPGLFGDPPTSDFTVLTGTFAHSALGSTAREAEIVEIVRSEARAKEITVRTNKEFLLSIFTILFVTL